VRAVRLPGFAGLTGRELCPNRRLGTEMSDHAKFRGGVKGIFHTDELPGYSITQAEVDALRSAAYASEGDAVVIVADDVEKSRRALTAVVSGRTTSSTGYPSSAGSEPRRDHPVHAATSRSGTHVPRD